MGQHHPSGASLAARRSAAAPARLDPPPPPPRHGRRRSVSLSALPVLAKTPTPLARRRAVAPLTLHVGMTADVAVEGTWLPARVVELAGDLCRCAVVTPLRGLSLQQALLASAAALLPPDAAALPQPPLRVAELWLGLSEVRHRLAFPVGVRSGVGHAALDHLWPCEPEWPAAAAAAATTAGALAGALTSVHVASAPPAGGAPAGEIAPPPLAPLGGGHVTRSSVLAAHLQHQELLAALRPGLGVDAQDARGAFRAATVLDVVFAAGHDPESAAGAIGRGGFAPLPAVIAVDLIWLDTGESERVPLAGRTQPVVHAAATAVGADADADAPLPPPADADPADALRHWPWRIAPAGAVTGRVLALHDFELGERVDVAVLDGCDDSSGTAAAPSQPRRTPQQQQQGARTSWRTGLVAAVRQSHVLVRFEEERAGGRHGHAAAAVGADDGGGAPCCAAGLLMPRPARAAAGAQPATSVEEEWVDVALQSWRLRGRRRAGADGGSGSAEQAAAAADWWGDEDAARARDEARAYRDALARAHVAPHTVAGDGNCLFRALALLLLGDAARHAQIRSELCEHMLAHARFFGALARAHGSALPRYVARMCAAGEWGGYVELVAAEERYDRKVLLFDKEAFLNTCVLAPRAIHFAGELPLLPGVAPLRLSYEGRNHYNALVPCGGGGGDAAAACGEEWAPPPYAARGSRLLLAARLARLAAQAADEDAFAAAVEARARAAAASAARAWQDEEVRRHVRAASGCVLRLSSGGAAVPTTGAGCDAAAAAARGADESRRASRRSLVLQRLAAVSTAAGV